MTNKDLLIQLLSEGTGESKALVTLRVNLVMRALEEQQAGSTAAFHKYFSPAQATITLQQMHQQQEEIIDWFTWQYQQISQN